MSEMTCADVIRVRIWFSIASPPWVSRLRRRRGRRDADDPDLGPDARAVVLVDERSAPARERAAAGRRTGIARADDRARGGDLRELGVGQIASGAAADGDVPGKALRVDAGLCAIAQVGRGLGELHGGPRVGAGITQVALVALVPLQALNALNALRALSPDGQVGGLEVRLSQRPV